MSKRILIVYSPMGDLNSHVEKEYMWHELMKEYSSLATTRTILTQSKKLVEFEDGTVLEMVQAGDVRGRRFTHLYVSESLVRMNNSFIENISPSFLPFAKERSERIVIFSFENGIGLNTKTYKGE